MTSKELEGARSRTFEGSPPVTAPVFVSWRARSHRMRFRRSKTGLALGSALGGRHAAREGSKHPQCEVHVKRPSTACHSLWKGMSLAVEGHVTRCGRACHSLWKVMSLAVEGHVTRCGRTCHSLGRCVLKRSRLPPLRNVVCARACGSGTDWVRIALVMRMAVDCCAVFRQLDMARDARRRVTASADRAPGPLTGALT